MCADEKCVIVNVSIRKCVGVGVGVGVDVGVVVGVHDKCEYACVCVC